MSKKTLNPQQAVYKNIEKRGYYNSFLPDQLLARHIAKLQEEASEAAVTLMDNDLHAWPFDIQHRILKDVARLNFDKGDWALYELPGSFDIETLKNELADVQVVLFSIAELINQHHTPFDVVAAAEAKSAADISRGVRE